MNPILRIYNYTQVCLQGLLLASSIHCLASGTIDPHFNALLRTAQTFQFCDVFFSFVGTVRSNPMMVVPQITVKNIIAWWGSVTYFPYLALVWSFSDTVRYFIHVVPPDSSPYIAVEWLRYSQYRVLYPIGIFFELVSILPTLESTVLKFICVVGYAIGFPKMFVHTSKLEMNRSTMKWLAEYSVDQHNDMAQVVVKYKSKPYYFDPVTFETFRHKFDVDRFCWKQSENEPNITTLCDRGIQIPWWTV